MLDKNRLDQSIWPFVPAKRVMSIQRAKGNYLYTKSGKKYSMLQGAVSFLILVMALKK